MDNRLYPLFLDLQGRPVLVVGGGAMGGQKALGLVAAGAQVTVVAPWVGDAVAAAAAGGQLRWAARRFVPADLDGACLVIAATGDPAVNAEVARYGAAARLFVNAVDDPHNASAYSAAVLERGPVKVAFSTGGRAPAVARLLRDLVALVLPVEGEVLTWVARAEELRRTWREAGVPMGVRYGKLLQELLRGAAPATASVQP